MITIRTKIAISILTLFIVSFFALLGRIPIHGQTRQFIDDFCLLSYTYLGFIPLQNWPFPQYIVNYGLNRNNKYQHYTYGTITGIEDLTISDTPTLGLSVKLTNGQNLQFDYTTPDNYFVSNKILPELISPDYFRTNEATAGGKIVSIFNKPTYFLIPFDYKHIYVNDIIRLDWISDSSTFTIDSTPNSNEPSQISVLGQVENYW